MLTSFASITVTVQRPGVLDDHGREVPDYSALTDHDEPGCIVQPAGFSEDPIQRDLTTTERLVLMPPAADVQRFDLVLLPNDPRPYRVKGEPAPWDSPTGSLSHLAVTLERYTEGLQ